MCKHTIAIGWSKAVQGTEEQTKNGQLNRLQLEGFAATCAFYVN